jgi:glutaminase
VNSNAHSEDLANYPYVSTGHLPPADDVVRLLDEAYRRYKSNTDGENSQVYPALAAVPSEMFGICVADTNGAVHALGDAEHEFSSMSVSKPFVFSLVCQVVRAQQAREKLGANATGCAFNSGAGIERSPNGRTNPMVNAGAIATRRVARELSDVVLARASVAEKGSELSARDPFQRHDQIAHRCERS